MIAELHWGLTMAKAKKRKEKNMLKFELLVLRKAYFCAKEDSLDRGWDDTRI